MKKLSILLPFAFMVSVCILTFSCQDCYEQDLQDVFNPNAPKYDENNYHFNTINLWGSEAAVIDSGDFYIFQGDIHLAKKDIDTIKTRGAARLNRNWPNNKIYYSLEGIPSQYVGYINRAIAWVENGSYITFVQRSNQSNYIQFNYLNQSEWLASSDYIGKKGGKQNIRLSTNAIQSIGTIAHEICHAVGMYHEMCRTDRDNYIRINFENMPESLRYQYKTYAERGESGKNIGPFDFGSIMMYDADQYMQKIDGSFFYGQRDSLSYTDMKTLAFLQPISQFTFTDKLLDNTSYNSDYEYRRSGMIQCPEGANISLKLQYKNNPSSSIYGSFASSDFSVKAIISIVNRTTHLEVFSREIELGKASAWTDMYINNIEIPQGGFDVRLTLRGIIRKGPETMGKLSVLKELMLYPMLYLHLNNVIINGESMFIPNNSSDANIRNLTFISIV